MKTIVLLIALLALSIGVFAQSQYENVLYLKNGVIIRGMIINRVGDYFLDLQTADQDVYEFKISEIAKITREAWLKAVDNGMPYKKNVTGTKSDAKTMYITMHRIVTKKLMALYELGTLNGLSANTSHSMWFSYKFTLGRQINPNFYLGGGFGNDVSGSHPLLNKEGNPIIDQFSNQVLLPMFVEARATLLKKRVAPFIGQQAGYSLYFPKTNDTDYPYPNRRMGGIMLQTQVGMQVVMTAKSIFSISVGYRYQQVTSPDYNVIQIEPPQFYPAPSEHLGYHFLTLIAGVHF